MILPIVAYGDPVLRKVAEDIDKDYPQLPTLIENMFETMYNASGVGLAAPQIGLPIRIFLVDTAQVLDNVEEEDIPEDEEPEEGIKMAFINARIVERGGEKWSYSEGCLSIPGINEEVSRLETLTIEYYDPDFNFRREEYKGFAARVIMHEYDHIEGKLFVDYLSSLRKRLLKRKLENITKGNVEAKYRMKFPKKKRKS